MSDDALTTGCTSPPELNERRPWPGPEVPQGPPPQLAVSPSKFLAAEASTVLSTLQTIPEFAETMELIDSVSTKSRDQSKWLARNLEYIKSSVDVLCSAGPRFLGRRGQFYRV